MGLINISMPMAVPPEGDAPAAFYASFNGMLQVVWAPGDDLVVRVAADAKFARLHAPLKAAMRFLPAGMTVKGSVADTDTLVLQTWPIGLVALRAAVSGPLPSEIRFANVAVAEVRTVAATLYAAIGRSAAAVDRFMEGKGLLRVKAGTAIGTATIAPSSAPPSPLPNLVTIAFRSADGADLNPMSVLGAFADAAQVDRASHPLLAVLGSADWVEVMATDADGLPLANAPYTLYLADGTTRTGSTDPAGRIYQAGLPPGPWAVDLPNQVSFALKD
ncbi:MAG TPA: hypothetical protein VNW71_13900 [Thermoanaerobaculia bacterium]|nr:hypothetical protein [Thermoanaerobaculia bacterium]